MVTLSLSVITFTFLAFVGSHGQELQPGFAIDSLYNTISHLADPAGSLRLANAAAGISAPAVTADRLDAVVELLRRRSAEIHSVAAVSSVASV